MTAYFIRRSATLIAVSLTAVTIVFLLMRLIPGDPVQIYLGPDASLEEIEQAREHLGLHRPIYWQYFRFMVNATRGDLGRSIISRRPVSSEIARTFKNTLVLAATAIAVAVLSGVVTGVLAAVKHHSPFDLASMVVAVLGIATPPFFLGLLLMYVFSITLRWLPSSGTGSLAHIVLPSVALGTPSVAVIARQTRSAMLEILFCDYVRTARAKGLPERVVIFKHALRNALIPVVTVIGLRFAYMVAGAVFTETVFRWPGMGRMLVDSVRERDYPLVQGIVLVAAVCFAAINMVIDIFYVWLDPRIRARSARAEG
ncbi:MAG: ABC transporter permease [bacterium]|nr:ABC transporter permease [bacterium]